ncbi:MAG: sigma 54-interacting transcriptional regulator [Proteocatella sp.]
MFDKMISSIFAVKNFFDEISVVDKNGIIRYCEIFIPDMYSFTADEIIGKHLFEVFKTSNESNSEVYQVLKTGKPVILFKEDLITYKGDKVKGYSSTYPIYKDNELIGAAVAMKVLDSSFNKEFIMIVDENKGIKSQGANNYTIDNLITSDPYMISIKQKIKKISKTDSYVLIEGKTGTGKEIVAQAIHYASNRLDKPFISQNCSAIPANLLESMLFGTEKGSFTGAITNKGLFELANGGTVFLDEINSMDISVQSKILKAIEEKSIRRLGGHKNIKVDIRIIAAINEDPFEAMKHNRLRDDLFYRINIISLKLNELKDRDNDVAMLTKYYIDYYNEVMKMNIIDIDKDVKAVFDNHNWPGNVRELRNAIESAFNLVEGRYITAGDIPDYMLYKNHEKLKNQNKDKKVNLENQNRGYEELMDEYERNIIEGALISSKTKAEAAKKLKLTRQTFNYKLDKLGLK